MLKAATESKQYCRISVVRCTGVVIENSLVFTFQVVRPPEGVSPHESNMTPLHTCKYTIWNFLKCFQESGRHRNEVLRLFVLASDLSDIQSVSKAARKTAMVLAFTRRRRSAHMDGLADLHRIFRLWLRASWSASVIFFAELILVHGHFQRYTRTNPFRRRSVLNASLSAAILCSALHCALPHRRRCCRLLTHSISGSTAWLVLILCEPSKLLLDIGGFQVGIVHCTVGRLWGTLLLVRLQDFSIENTS